MPIDVTCPGCHTRFKVSEKFAGKEGPCPKCKKVIKVPELEEQVVVHAPEYGPKDKGGKSVLKPIARTEAKVTAITWVFSIGCLLVILLVSFLLRDKENQAQPVWLLAIGAVAVAIPIARAGYAFLRDDELEPFSGKELWIRVSIVSVLYASTWAALTWIPVALGLETMVAYEALILVGVAIALGTAVAHFGLEIELGSAFIHYCFYLGATVLLRIIMGLSFISPELAS